MSIVLRYSHQYRPTAHKASRPHQIHNRLPPRITLVYPRTDHLAYGQLLQESLAQGKVESSSHQTRANDPTIDDMEASRLEIALLALGIFVLVVQMCVLVWVAVKRRHQISGQAPRLHGRASQPCLWKEAFDEPPSHELLLGRPSTTSEKTSLVERVRRTSEHITAEVQQQLVDLGRKIAANGNPTYRTGSPPPRDVEVGMTTGAEEKPLGIRRSLSGIKSRAESLVEPIFLGGLDRPRWGFRRHSSWVPSELQPPRRKSYNIETIGPESLV
ncbi:hypothetical protein B0H63DRAFT_277358 [Podospora didyma]|uniref:Uncharacterized protein n=1 Tax=Podospora didyma TaxID=330526 RepID=A0AAE0KEK5_9PEZI|nr:hypothetical protein B0H63DRAFT_277358 [Podospora didyma]